MGYIGRQDLDKFVNEELDKIKEIENSTTEKIKGFKKEISTQYEDFKKDIKENFTYVSNGKKLLETTIIDRGGKVSKSKDIASFEELKNGIETVETKKIYNFANLNTLNPKVDIKKISSLYDKVEHLESFSCDNTDSSKIYTTTNSNYINIVSANDFQTIKTECVDSGSKLGTISQFNKYLVVEGEMNREDYCFVFNKDTLKFLCCVAGESPSISKNDTLFTTKSIYDLKADKYIKKFKNEKNYTFLDVYDNLAYYIKYYSNEIDIYSIDGTLQKTVKTNIDDRSSIYLQKINVNDNYICAIGLFSTGSTSNSTFYTYIFDKDFNLKSNHKGEYGYIDKKHKNNRLNLNKNEIVYIVNSNLSISLGNFTYSSSYPEDYTTINWDISNDGYIYRLEYETAGSYHRQVLNKYKCEIEI